MFILFFFASVRSHQKGMSACPSPLWPSTSECGHGTCTSTGCQCDWLWSGSSDIVGAPVQDCMMYTPAVAALWGLVLLSGSALVHQALISLSWCVFSTHSMYTLFVCGSLSLCFSCIFFSISFPWFLSCTHGWFLQEFFPQILQVRQCSHTHSWVILWTLLSRIEHLQACLPARSHSSHWC